jgi:hypothetical protein
VRDLRSENFRLVAASPCRLTPTETVDRKIHVHAARIVRAQLKKLHVKAAIAEGVVAVNARHAAMLTDTEQKDLVQSLSSS